MAMHRVMEVTTPLGDDLLFHRLHAREEVSRLSEFELDLLSLKGNINLDDVVGKSFTVKLELPDSKTRYFNGYVTRFGQTGMQGRYHVYHATLRPWLWFLTRTSDCRIFQEQTVPDIIKKVFGDHSAADFKFDLTAKYRKWDYCVQYRETDFNFVSRLMEQEGFYYYFTHNDGRHTMVLADSYSKHSPFPGYEEVHFVTSEKLKEPEQDHVSDWHFSREIQPAVYAIDDYDFERPSVELVTKQKATRKHDHADCEVYDYPGEYIQKADGDTYAQTRLDELQTQFELAHGTCNARGLCVGRTFKLVGQPRDDQNREYVVLAATHQLEFGGYESADAGGASYSCNFSVLSTKQQYRPQRLTPKPIVQGPQTAIVVGPDGDEIYTDKYGRVKVQFHWDRYGKKNENSSCWVRVSHPWAGKNWGMVAIPRIGQEVIVDFLEGDPDEPIITGRVYNAEQMPPYALPANMTQSGILSRSSKGGSGANANEFRFEDKKGSEQVYLHAEKNQDLEVEKDETHWVGHDRTKTIDNDEKTTVKHDRTELVLNNEDITIGVNRTEKVGNNEITTIGNDQTETILGSRMVTVNRTKSESVLLNSSETVGLAKELTIGGLYQVTVGGAHNTTVGGAKLVEVGGYSAELVGGAKNLTVGGNHTVTVKGKQSIGVTSDRSINVDGKSDQTVKGEYVFKAKKIDITAEDELTITVGSAKIVLKKDGTILLDGKDVNTNASGKVNVKASGDIILKGSTIKEN